MDMPHYCTLVLALLLVVLNGFFVAVEFSLVKLRKMRVREFEKTKGRCGKILAKVHAHLDTYLSACQLGITLASLGLGWAGEPAFAHLLNPLFDKIAGLSTEVRHGAAFICAFSVISFLHIVIGELAPKSMAIRNPERIGLWGAVPLYGFYWLMYPVIWLLNSSADIVLRLFGLKAALRHDIHYTPNELKLILRSNHPNEHFTRDEWNILAKTLDFSELEVVDLMRPIQEMTALYRSKTLQENLEIVYHKRFSRYPYFDFNGMDVLGVIHLKDLFFAQQKGRVTEELIQYLRPIQYIPADTPALELFRLFRKGAPHFAVIGQKGYLPSGFITLDNLLSAMVGEIRDEFRHNSNDWIKLADGGLIGKGSLPIFTLERILGIDIENEDLELEDEVSIGGLIFAKLRDIPEEAQKIEFEQFDVVIKKMNGPCIEMVKIFPKELPGSDFY